jgi:type IV secretory pathway TraG/TraD family ATPase VirD4
MTYAQTYAQRRKQRDVRRGRPPIVRLPALPFGWRQAVVVFVLFNGALMTGLGNAKLLDPRHVREYLTWLSVASFAPLFWWIIASLQSGEVRPLNGWLRLFCSFTLGSVLVGRVMPYALLLLLRAHAGTYILAAFLAAALPLSWWIIELSMRALEGRRFSVPWRRFAPSIGGKEDFALWIGQATGLLANLRHNAGIARGSSVVLTLPDAAQNVLVLGGIGSGKTTRAVNPLLLQLLDQQCGGLVFNVKGNFGYAVDELARETGRIVVRIGPGHEPMNLLAGLTPEVAASFLKSAFLINGAARDGFWIDTAAELCRNALGVLSYLPDRYGLDGLYRYLFDPKIRMECDTQASKVLSDLRAAGSEREARSLATYQRYHDDVFGGFEERLRSNVNAQVAQVLSPFSHPDLADAFCSAAGVAMEPVLDGTVYFVELPLARYGLGAKVAYTFVKLRFFNVVQRRRSEPAWNQDRPVFFVCDEYQEIISAARDALSDLTFWDKARESGCVGVIAAQSISSFYAAIGDRDIAKTVLQNFRQLLCFRTEDDATIARLVELLGQVEVARVSSTRGKSSGRDTTTTHSTSLSWSRQHVITPQLFRELGPDQALALLSIGGRAYDDVLTLDPVYVGSQRV